MCLQLRDVCHTGVFMSACVRVGVRLTIRQSVFVYIAQLRMRAPSHVCARVQVRVCAPGEVLVPTALI